MPAKRKKKAAKKKSALKEDWRHAPGPGTYRKRRSNRKGRRDKRDTGDTGPKARYRS
jgi:hypothetical protein